MRKLFVSISGGRTSAYMAIRLQLEYRDRYDMKFIYANTGLEHEETLLFLDGIDRKYQLGVTWVEAVISSEKGVGTGHKIVDFESATRDGRLFEEMIKVYGIPNTSYPHCNRELKIQAMNSYVKSIGWDKEYRAIGIRADEPSRVPDGASKDRKLYPLVDFFPTDKLEVIDWFKGKEFDLKISDHLGNCVTCWKKGDPKIFKIIRDDPERFEFFKRMERDHGLAGSNMDGTKRVFFRNHRSAEDMFRLEKEMPGLDFGAYDSCSSEECGLE